MKFWKLLTAASVVAVMAANAPAFAQTDEKLPEFTTEGFDEWLVEFKKEAASKGISDATLDVAFANTKPIPKVIEYDRSQPEFKLTFEQYLDRVVPQSRINEGRKKYAEDREIIDAAAKKYGVPGHYLTAFWGIETGFGRFTGGYSVVDSLATLAFEGRRAEYFRKELMNALTIIDAGHIAPEKMSGSWAGAMGQAQFMPSTFLNYARDGNGDGKIDLWGQKKTSLPLRQTIFPRSDGMQTSAGAARFRCRKTSTPSLKVAISANQSLNGRNLAFACQTAQICLRQTWKHQLSS